MIVDIDEAKRHLSHLVERAAAGTEIIIAEAGHPVARLVPYAGDRAPRSPGRWAGRVTIAPDFDESLDWLVNDFEGG